jgi:L-lactate dehydrogenase complex protein LldE
MPGPRVALFVTCLVDLFRPSVGFASIKLLTQAGCTVEVPEAQTCCGQPAWNSGDKASAAAIARQVIEVFEGYDHVVVPSGSCGGTMVKDYPKMFAEGDPWRDRARTLSEKTHEITAFLRDVLKVRGTGASFPTTLTYHDSCSALRGLGIRQQPRDLLRAVAGVEIREMAESDVCCGFGGTFCVKYPEISNVMVGDKTGNIAATGADLVVSGDLGCLLNLAGKAKREGRSFRARHVVEILAGSTAFPAIGDSA